MDIKILLKRSFAFIIALCSAYSATAQFPSELCTFVEENGILTIEMESGDFSGTFWQKKTDIADYTGSGYLQYIGGHFTGIPGNSQITYTFRIQNPGRYSFKMRAYRTSHEDNDVWVRFPDGGVMTKIEGDNTGVKDDEWFKFLIGARNAWSYFMKTQHSHTGESLHDVYVDFPAAGVYTVQVSGRSTGFRLDRFTLYNTSGFYGMNPANPESDREDCEPFSYDGPHVSNPIPDQSVNAGNAYSYTIPANTFTHPTDMTMTIVAHSRAGQALPAWLSYNSSTQTLSGNPVFEDGGVYHIMIRAIDNDQRFAVDEFDLTVVGNNPPTLVNEIPDANATVDEPFTYTFAADAFQDPDGHPLTFSAALPDGAMLPDWLTFNPATRTFSGTPSEDDEGSLAVLVTADDGYGGSAQALFRIHVTMPFIAGINNRGNSMLSVSRVFPNPVEDRLVVELNNAEPVAVTIFDNMGRSYKVSRIIYSGNNVEIDLSDINLKPGIFFLHLNSEKTGAGYAEMMIRK